jgi:hypothetical protein
MSSNRRDEPIEPVTPVRKRLQYDPSTSKDSPRRRRAIMNGLNAQSSDEDMGDYQTADSRLRSPVRPDNRAMSSVAGKRTAAAVLESRSSTTMVHESRRTAPDNTTIDDYDNWSDDQFRESYGFRVDQLKLKDQALKAKDKELKAKNEELEAKDEQIKALEEEVRLLKEERALISSRASQRPSPSKAGMQVSGMRDIRFYTTLINLS